jgi:2-C-methyl-D-erythritol 4-phosphate cytidylyltransferase
MELLTPRVNSKEKFLEIANGKSDLHAAQLRLVKGSPLNVRIAGPGDAQLLKTMLSMLPRQKKAGPLNPFEEAQW